MQVARALFNKGVTHGQRDEPEAALAAYDDLIARFGASDVPDIQVQVAMALLNKGLTHGQRDEPEAVLTAYDDLVARFGASDAPDIQLLQGLPGRSVQQGAGAKRCSTRTASATSPRRR